MADSYIDYIYRYPFASAIAEGNGGSSELNLATSERSNEFPHFFEGKLLQPRAIAQMLFVLSKIVSTRFYIPPAMLEKLILERDPVITSGGQMLRFEGFSACCSTYARVDVSPEAYKGQVVGTGTTNVDFNSPMRSALAMVRDEDNLSMSVGAEKVTLRHGFAKIEERKVQLPLRWIKGFVEVQAYQSRMETRLNIGKVETVRFLRSLPSSTSSRSVFFVVPSGKGLRLSQRDDGSGVKVGGSERLLLLRALAPLADDLSVYAMPDGEASEWRLRCGGLTFCLTLSAEPSRGFSGEGQVLSDLANVDAKKLSSVRSALKWQSCVDVSEISRLSGLQDNAVRQNLSLSGSRGLVGYDLGMGSYFHRELPFEMERVEELHPRLKSARKLVEHDGVRIKFRDEERVEAVVKGTDVYHSVKISPTGMQCTCPWHSKYQGLRGPCKHILSAQMVVDDNSGQD
ncbi:MAG: hypothetical protein K2Y39_17270 [Candidatus Obscuribacterales bacterium]|nr:hypothetical protein [Candidatus Obscuribacterales bacterium]